MSGRSAAPLPGVIRRVLGLVWQPYFTTALQAGEQLPPAGEEREPQVVFGSGELLE